MSADKPLSVVAVIFALPCFMPFTMPSEDTVAMLVSLDFHVIVVVAFSGSNVYLILVE